MVLLHDALVLDLCVKTEVSLIRYETFMAVNMRTLHKYINTDILN